jgi:hypothetical protein
LGRDGKNVPLKDTRTLEFRKEKSINDRRLNENKSGASQKYFFLNPPKPI